MTGSFSLNTPKGATHSNADEIPLECGLVFPALVWLARVHGAGKQLAAIAAVPCHLHALEQVRRGK
jgi:hypothetical protein